MSNILTGDSLTGLQVAAEMQAKMRTIPRANKPKRTHRRKAWKLIRSLEKLPPGTACDQNPELVFIADFHAAIMVFCTFRCADGTVLNRGPLQPVPPPSRRKTIREQRRASRNARRTWVPFEKRFIQAVQLTTHVKDSLTAGLNVPHTSPLPTSQDVMGEAADETQDRPLSELLRLKPGHRIAHACEICGKELQRPLHVPLKAFEGSPPIAVCWACGTKNLC